MKKLGLWRAAAVIMAAAALLSLGGYYHWQGGTQHHRAAEQAARAFFTAIVEGRFEDAASMATAPVAARLSRAGLDPASPGESLISVRAAAWGAGFARVTARVENQIAGDRWDVLWFDADLARGVDGQWRVVRVDRARPDTTGQSGRVPDDFDPSAFTDYLRALARGDSAGAAGSLAGPARAGHEQGAAAVGAGQVPLFNEFTEPDYAPLWGSAGIVVAQAKYAIDGRPVTALVTFYRLKDGWKVVDVLSTGG